MATAEAAYLDRPSRPARPSGLPTSDGLFSFLEGLRRDGYKIDARHIAAAECLLMDARAEAAESESARRFKYRLAPVIAKSPAQQTDFYRRFDAWRGPVVVDRVRRIAGRTKEGPATEVIKRDPRRYIIAGTVVALLAVAGFATWYFWPQAEIVGPDTTDQTGETSSKAATDVPPSVELPQESFETTERLVSPYYKGLKIGLMAAPALAFAAWLLLRWRQRVLWMSHGTTLGDAEVGTVHLPDNLSDKLFSTAEFRSSAQDLRKHRYLPTWRLDAYKTVDATARSAGLFTPIYRERPQLPEYVFLIEHTGANDHVARLFDLAIEQLRRENVEIQRYYYQSDPRLLQTDDRDGSTISLAELAARTDDHRLFVIGTAEGFFHPLTGDVERWVGRLDPWNARTLMSTKPLEQWGRAELRLLDEGFSLATAEATGFSAVSEKVAVGDDTPELLEGTLVQPVSTRAPSAWAEPLATPPPSITDLLPRLKELRDRASRYESDGSDEVASSLADLIRVLSLDNFGAREANSILSKTQQLVLSPELGSLYAPRLFAEIAGAIETSRKQEGSTIQVPRVRAEAAVHAPKIAVGDDVLADFQVFKDIDAPWCPEMVALPAGQFLMGAPEEEEGRYENEGPQHLVTIGYRLAMGRYPVTFEEYDHFCAVTGRKQPDNEGWGRDRRPVINVSQHDAKEYCNWLAEETGQAYRLLSEAEWEYACRAGTTTRYVFGDEISKNSANFRGVFESTTEVGSYPANPWGLHDLHGNVWEWVEDVLQSNYQDAPTDGSPWLKDTSEISERVIRGGSWSNRPQTLRSALRGWYLSVGRGNDLGFRVSRTLTS